MVIETESQPPFVVQEQECQMSQFLATKDIKLRKRHLDIMTTSKSLHHTFDIEYAEEYKSVEIAIIIHHFQHWINVNKSLKRNFHQARTWTYQTLEEIAAHFPYWSIDQIKRLINKAVDLRILIKGNFNKSNYDRTTWYAFENEEKFTIRRNRQMDVAESSNGSDGIASPIPDTKPYNIPDRGGEDTHALSLKKKKEIEEVATIHYGDYVRLKEGEYEKFCKNMGKDLVDYYIQAINNWVPNNETKKDYAATIRQWHLRDRAKNDLPDLKKIQETALPPSPERLEANKKICSWVEHKLRSRFTSTILFIADSKKATLVNKHKDFKKEYDYEKIDPPKLKEILLNDLEVCFPGSKDFLKGNTTQKVSGLINNLADTLKCK